MSEHYQSPPYNSPSDSTPYKKQLLSQTQANQPINLIPSQTASNSNINVSINYNFQEKPSNQLPMNMPQNTALTQEAQSLIQRWKSGNFAEFNRWMQISKTDCKVEFTMRSAPNGSKTFVCNMALNFTKNPQINPFFSSGIGKSKKEAKSKAIESILMDLIQKNCLKFGLKNNQDPTELTNSESNLSLKVLKKNYITKKLRNLNYEMVEFLKQDRFQDACEIFRRLVSMKTLEWRDTFSMWSFVLLKHNLPFVTIFLELLRFDDSSNLDSSHPNHNMKKVNEELMKRYGFSRETSQNLFEIYDNFNIYVREIEFVNDSKTLTIEDLNKSDSLFPNISSIDIMTQMVPYGEDLNKFFPNKSSDTQNAAFNKNPEISATIPEASNLGGNPKLVRRESIKGTEENKGVSYKIINSLYDSLIYIGDLGFALRVAELIYSKLKISHEELIGIEAADYFMNQKNILTLELLESMFQLFSRTKEKKLKIISNITGTLEKVGGDLSEMQLNFSPNMSHEEMAKNICFKKNSEYKENFLQLAEGDYVILTSFRKEGEAGDSPYDNTASLKNYLNMFSAQNKSNNLGDEAKLLINTLNKNGSSFEEALIGNISEITSEFNLKINILPNKTQTEHILTEQKEWKLTKLFNKETYDKSSEALLNFVTKSCMSNNLEKILLNPKQAHKETQIFPQFYQNFGSVVNPNLNQMQNMACTFAFSQPLTLIEGAPGTGKTFLATQIILQWVRQSPLPILACSSTVKATDILFTQIKQLGLKSIKLGLDLDEIQDLNKNLLFNQFSTNLTTEQYDSLNFKMTKRMISEAQIVCCTCLGASSPLLNNMIFTRVLIDEAQQISELETLVPIVKKCQQLVLLGDRKKLPPKAISFLAQTKGMSISMFERFILAGIQPINLSMQYKMHPTISVFPSYHFYNNLLENSNVYDQSKSLNVFSRENQVVRELWVQVKGEEEIFESSLMNRKEIETTLSVLLYLLQEEKVNPKDIEIMTFFAGQQFILRREIQLLAKRKPEIFKITPEEEKNNHFSYIDVDLLDDCTVFFCFIGSIYKNHSQRKKK